VSRGVSGFVVARRTRSKTLAIVLAAGFIALLVMELLAIFAPAIQSSLGRKAATHGLRLEVYAPVSARGDAEAFASKLASYMGTENSVVPVNVSLPDNMSMLVLVVYKDSEPLLVTLSRPIDNETALRRVADALVRLALEAEKLPSNESLLYLGGDKLEVIPRNTTMIKGFIDYVYMQLAALHAHAAAAAAGNTTSKS
jgi:hypothetical protein